MNIIEVSINRLKEYENNPRNNELAVSKIKSSIKHFGFLFPVIIDINYVIVCGHTRVRACKELGIEHVPCIVADELTDEQINLFRLVDNKTSEYSEWDLIKLKKELSLIDLNIDTNALILEEFDLTPEMVDLDVQSTELTIKSTNFNDVSDRTKRSPANKQSSAEASNDVDILDDISEEDILNDINEGNADDLSDDEFVEDTVAEGDGKKESKPLLSLNRLRFGDISFFISKIELERLNEKYKAYVESDLMTKISFVDYLVKGLNQSD